MKILHLCSYYIGNSLYSHIAKTLSEKNVKQFFYVPVRRVELVGKNHVNNKNVSIIYSYILRPWHRLLFNLKIKTMHCDIEKHVKDIQTFEIIHAHCLYSDGALALELFKKYKIPYVVSVRNTDINCFYKYALHLRKKCYQILSNSKKIIFLGPIVAENFIQKLPETLQKEISNKVVVLPNGVDSFWINEKTKVLKPKGDWRILFVGRLDKNKNLKNVIKACDFLLMNKYGIYLEIVAPLQGNYSRKLLNMISKRDYIKMYGEIKNREVLKSLYRNANVTVIPSYRESFGIAFLESIAQATPIVYSIGQGIDGWLTYAELGYGVDSYDYKSIAKGIITACESGGLNSKCINQFIERFRWTTVCNELLELYL